MRGSCLGAVAIFSSFQIVHIFKYYTFPEIIFIFSYYSPKRFDIHFLKAILH